MKPKKNNHSRGFALVVTLTLMVLLSILALGLLSLSSISIRTASRGDGMAIARANAKLALVLAIGDLQKAAGPDQAVTATSEIIAQNPAKPNLTGVWDSWDYDVNSSSLDYNAPKTRKSDVGTPGFKGWLVSDSNFQDPSDRDYPTSPFTGESIELVGKGALGNSTASTDFVRAGKVALTKDGKKTGTYAWHISDESVKARINTYRDPGANQTLSQRRSLQAGHRPDLLAIENSENTTLNFLPNDNLDYVTAMLSTAKLVSLNQAELFDNTPTIKTFRNDVTPYSLGLLTNVREGGLKQDLTSAFELATTNSAGAITGLPAEFEGKRIYQTNVFSGGAGVTGASDPYWTALAGYYNSYKDLITPETSPTLYKAPPEDIVLARPDAAGAAQPRQYSPAPVIAKVELLFSFLVRNKHGSWKNNGAYSDFPYLAHLLFTPVITLHNPYNVSLQFDRMKVGIKDAPIGIQIFRDGAAVSPDPLRMGQMFKIANAAGGNKSQDSKQFWIEIGNWSGPTASTTSGAIVLKPGESKVYGPYIEANEPFGEGTASYFDSGNNLTGTKNSPLKSKSGFAGANIGFDVDWLAGKTNQNDGVVGLKPNQGIHIEFKPLAAISNIFDVEAEYTANGQTRPLGGLNFTYANQSTLDKVLPNGVMRYPTSGTISAQAMYASNGTPNGAVATQKSFALFSAYARTSNGGVDGTGQRTQDPTVPMPDGRLAGNPFLNNNPARPLVFSRMAVEKPANQSHELNLLPLPDGSADDAFSIAADQRTNVLVNYRQLSGKSIKSGSYLEIPSGPMQAISDFRRSNVLSSPYLPAVAQPIGNSYVSPMVETGNAIQPGLSSGYAYPLLDHSVLANHALYDRYYFSTFAPFGSGSAQSGFASFMTGEKPLRSQLFKSYLPNGMAADEAQAELFASSGKPTVDAYHLAAKYQMVKGAFNVNSTRVQAWKAMLSSLTRTQMNVLWAKSGLLESVPAAGVPIPAMTLHNGSATDGTFSANNIDDHAANLWNGYREFSDAEIEKLAVEIVEEVRLRGPFQSMSEFVNRRLGNGSDLTRTGALQKAIDDSGLNNSSMNNQVPVTLGDLSDANLYGFKTPLAATGNPAAGAPGWVSQGDVLKILEPAATVRSDTFVIRTYGEAIDSAGNVVANAYAEAVVQRIPEYVNSTDPPEAKPVNPNVPAPAGPVVTAQENKDYGRKFIMTSFKWLSPNEI